MTRDATALDDPLTRFQRELARARTLESSSSWLGGLRRLFQRLHAVEPYDVTAVALATATAQGAPSVRYVLLKAADDRGFVFYTNRESRKGEELAANARAALAFLWPTLAVQVRVEGTVELVSDAESDAYFASRPRGSQLGAWASQQSRPLASRKILEEALATFERRFADRASVPRPPYWGGYRLVPSRIEFWQGRESRLHERDVYVREGRAWRLGCVYP